MKKSKLMFFIFLIFGCSDSSVVERWTDGTVKTKLFIDGNNECYEYYGEHNKVIEEGCFYGKEKNGKWITYFENGNIETITHYQHGVLGGEYFRFSEKGKMIEKMLYIDGYAEDKMKADDNQSYKVTQEDVVMEETNYNKATTTHKEYYDNGTLKAIGEMDVNLKVGEWKYFHPSGNLWAKGKYIRKAIYEVEEGIREDKEFHFFPIEETLKIGKWEFYSNKELTYKADYRLKNNKYTCRVRKIKD